MRIVSIVTILLACLLALVSCETDYPLVDEIPVDASANDSVLLEAVMTMYGARRRGRNLVINRSQLHDVINFGKNSTRVNFLHQLQRRLQESHRAPVINCQTIESLLNNSGLSLDEGLKGSELAAMLPRLFFAMQNPDCFIAKAKPRALTDPMAWIYSLLAVLAMKLCALVGILAFPCMSATVFTMSLSFLVPLAISSLMGSTLFIFVPQILNLEEIGHYNENYGDPIVKMVVIGCGIYLFYLIEKMLRLLMEHKEKQFYKKNRTNRSYSLYIAQEKVSQKPSRKLSVTMAGDITSFSRSIETKRDSRIALEDIQTVAGAVEEKKQQIAPIAWIAILGDCIRNFIDGIAIGAAFSISPLVGVSLSLAFVFEEIPTELGDVAILLTAGMTICRAGAYHCFAAVFAFFGAACGILLGDLGESQIWIFAISAGAFLYIALVDLMPEMNHAMDSERAKEIGRVKIFILQNAGLVIGFAVTAVLGIYKDSLHIDFGH